LALNDSFPSHAPYWFKSEIQAITYAKCYLILRGYHHALSVTVPVTKALQEVDRKLHNDYDITYDKSKVKRRRGRGEANIRMIRHRRNILLVATGGNQPTFFRNPQVANLRQTWLTFGKHKLTLVNAGKEKLKIRVTENTYQTALERILKQALRQRETLEAEIKDLDWYWSKDTLRQRSKIWQKVNHQRKIHKLPPLRYEAIKEKPKFYK
jgi:hypothetical protein